MVTSRPGRLCGAAPVTPFVRTVLSPSGGTPVIPRLVSWSSDSAGVMYRARGPSDRSAGYGPVGSGRRGAEAPVPSIMSRRVRCPVTPLGPELEDDVDGGLGDLTEPAEAGLVSQLPYRRGTGLGAGRDPAGLGQGGRRGLERGSRVVERGQRTGQVRGVVAAPATASPPRPDPGQGFSPPARGMSCLLPYGLVSGRDGGAVGNPS